MLGISQMCAALYYPFILLFCYSVWQVSLQLKCFYLQKYVHFSLSLSRFHTFNVEQNISNIAKLIKIRRIHGAWAIRQSIKAMGFSKFFSRIKRRLRPTALLLSNSSVPHLYLRDNKGMLCFRKL